MSRLAIPVIVVFVILASCGENQDQQGTVGPYGMDEASNSASGAQPRETSIVSGMATYRERMALPADATFEATLEDTSRADAPSRVIGRARIAPAGQPPFVFRITYDPAQLEEHGSYAVRARITRGDQLMFTTDRHYPMPAAGEPLELMLVRAGISQAPAAVSGATLENTYWKLIQLGGEAVSSIDEKREPHLVLHSEDRRVAGHGGCNRFTGTYSVSGEQLTFSQMAGTMMACADGMQYERAFHDALTKVASWKIEGEQLELFDAAGDSLARFESRDMK